MNEASQWRLYLAQRIAPVYARHPGVAVVEVGGSTAMNLADRWSDVEIGVFWHEPPSEKERLAVISHAGGELNNVYPHAHEEWAEDWYLRGVKIDVGHRTLGDTEAIIGDVVLRADTTVWKQTLLHVLQHCVPLYGDAVILDWRRHIEPYPPDLARAMIATHLDFGPHWFLEMLAERRDLLKLYEITVMAEQRVLGTLMGLNGVYHPGYKWFRPLAEDTTMAPPDLASRLAHVLRAEPAEAVTELGMVIEETFDLVERHMPDFDTAARLHRFRWRRSPHDVSPFDVWDVPHT